MLQFLTFAVSAASIPRSSRNTQT